MDTPEGQSEQDRGGVGGEQLMLSWEHSACHPQRRLLLGTLEPLNLGILEQGKEV